MDLRAQALGNSHRAFVIADLQRPGHAHKPTLTGPNHLREIKCSGGEYHAHGTDRGDAHRGRGVAVARCLLGQDGSLGAQVRQGTHHPQPLVGALGVQQRG